jgi:hypothetical protein
VKTRRFSTPLDQRRQVPGTPAAGNRGVGHGCQAFLGDIVDHLQDAEAPPVSEPILNEIHSGRLPELPSPAVPVFHGPACAVFGRTDSPFLR